MKNMLSARAASKYVNLPPAHFKKLVDGGFIPCWTDPITGQRRFPRLALDAWMTAFAADAKRAS